METPEQLSDIVWKQDIGNTIWEDIVIVKM